MLTQLIFFKIATLKSFAVPILCIFQINLNWKSSILKIKQFGSNVETAINKVKDETIVNIAVKSGITEESMKSNILKLSECMRKLKD